MVIGSGATGMTAAIVAREAGASVIVVEQEPDIGGPAGTRGGEQATGGGASGGGGYGTSAQMAGSGGWGV